MSTRAELIELIKNQNLSETDEIKIDGPWGTGHLEGLKIPIYGVRNDAGMRVEIGTATVSTKNGLTFTVELKEGHKDTHSPSFEVPMQFRILRPDK